MCVPNPILNIASIKWVEKKSTEAARRRKKRVNREKNCPIEFENEKRISLREREREKPIKTKQIRVDIET